MGDKNPKKQPKKPKAKEKGSSDAPAPAISKKK